ncbi:hypothetical protein BHE74_00048420 [Ensete ventricosum]|nr:hypothetical protein BHE74_00048420 [Ensete ventricosum]
MVQAIIPYIPQLAQVLAHQHLDAPRQTLQQRVPQSTLTREEHHDNGVPRRLSNEVMAEILKATVIQPTSHSRNVVHIPSEPDAVSLDSTDSVREQPRQVNQRLDKVQREFVKLKEEVGETSKALDPGAYDTSTDPSEHIATFRAQMALYDTSDALICCAFPTTLKRSAQMWYNRLKPFFISSFYHLAKELELNFMASSRPRPTAASLLSLAQGSDEPLAQFIDRFTVEVRRMHNAHPSLAIQAFLIELRPS